LTHKVAKSLRHPKSIGDPAPILFIFSAWVEMMPAIKTENDSRGGSFFLLGRRYDANTIKKIIMENP